MAEYYRTRPYRFKNLLKYAYRFISINLCLYVRIFIMRDNESEEKSNNLKS